MFLGREHSVASATLTHQNHQTDKTLRTNSFTIAAMNILHQLHEQAPCTIVKFLLSLNQNPEVHATRLGDRLTGTIFSNTVIYVHDSGIILAVYDLPDIDERRTTSIETGNTPVGFRLSPIEKLLQVSRLLRSFLNTTSCPALKVENVVLTPCTLINYDEMQEVWRRKAFIFHQMPDDELRATLWQQLRDDASLPGSQLVNTFCTLLRGMPL